MDTQDWPTLGWPTSRILRLVVSAQLNVAQYALNGIFLRSSGFKTTYQPKHRISLLSELFVSRWVASVPPCILSSRTQRFRTKVYNEKSLFHNAGTSRNILLQIKDDRLLPFTEKEVPKRILRAIAGCWTWAPSERPDVDGISLEAEQCAQDRAPMVIIGTTFQGSRILVKFFFFYPRLNPIICSTWD